MAMALNLVLIGLAMTLDSLPLTAFIAVLPSKRGVTKGAAFVFGSPEAPTDLHGTELGRRGEQTGRQ